MKNWIQAFLVLTSRELGSQFVSLRGYVVLAASQFIIGACFSYLIEQVNTEQLELPASELFFATWYYWLILLLSTPMITMRLFATEKALGTYETLITAPVSDLEILLAKFSSAVIFYLIIWTPLIIGLASFNRLTGNSLNIHPGAIIGTFLGVLLIGAMYMSIGCLASSVTKSQNVAAILAFVFGTVLFLIGTYSSSLATSVSWLASVISYISMVQHMPDFVRGVIDSRHIVFYLSTTIFFLFVTLKILESSRWR